MSFGSHTAVDYLSWAAVILVGVKAVATVILLANGGARQLRGGFDTALWWSTKITPILAVPCLIAIALIENRVGEAWGYAALMLFVLVMVPVMIWKRFYRRPNAVPAPPRS